MASRSQILAMRKREDEDFRRVTENAELEEEVCETWIGQSPSPNANLNSVRICAGSEND